MIFLQKMGFRLAQTDDLEILNSISVRSKNHWNYPESWMEQWKDDLILDDQKLKEQNVLLVEIDKKIIGFCSVVENIENCEVLHLWVIPEHIGKGIGKKLLAETIKRFVYHAKPIIVEADPNAEPFYQSQGFTTFDKVESFLKGRFLPVMRRELENG